MTVLREMRQHKVNHQPDLPLLLVDRLSYAYNGGQPALQDVSFALTVGERVAVVGPNGAGKSTLFQVIAGILKPSQGSVTIAGSGPSQHICIAYVPQRTQVDWRFPVNVADVVMMGRIGRIGFFHRPQALDWTHVHQCLDVVGMSRFANQQIGALSGGQQQRVFIARALAQEAELMLMDEPLTGLDIASQEDILEILDTLRQRQVTVMVATHDLELAASRFDRIMLLQRRLVSFGQAGDALTPDHLLDAYGGHLRLIHTDQGDLVIGDTCCGHGEL